MANSVLAGTSAKARPNTTSEELSSTTIPTTTDPAELEREADAILGRLLIRGSKNGVYSQVQLDRKMRRENKRAPMLAEHGVSNDTVEYLVERQIEELIDAADLTAIQEIIYRLHVAGFSSKRIAAVIGIKRRTIDWRLKLVKRKVIKAYKEGKYAGWYEVYLSEINRGR